MPDLGAKLHQRAISTVGGLDKDFEGWRTDYLELAEYLMPRRYIWLQNKSGNKSFNRGTQRSSKILDPAGTFALRKMAAGMQGGMTSPARPWFRLNSSLYGPDRDEPVRVRRFLDRVQLILQRVLGKSNFYQTINSAYVDLGCYGTSCIFVYEDEEDIIRCFLSPIGEFRLGQDSQRRVNTFARDFETSVEQLVARFGFENCSEQVRNLWEKGGAGRFEKFDVSHIIESNYPDENFLGPDYQYREYYWEKSQSAGKFLELAAYEERPAFAPRWDLIGNNTYGESPGMLVLPDVIQLQHETLKKAQALDKMVSPPLVADVAVRSLGTPSTFPNSVTYVPQASQVGARPIYEVRPPLQELTQDLLDLRGRIREGFYNDLFDMISQLQTVRSATEIDARQEEKLVLLGPVLERFEQEVLAPVIQRVFGILARRGLLPDPPPELAESGLEIEYTSILSEAQRAIGIGASERFVQIVAQMAPTWQEVTMIVDPQEFLRDYADQLNVPGRIMRSRAEIEELLQQQRDIAEQREAAEVGQLQASAARDLAQAEAGAGAAVAPGVV